MIGDDEKKEPTSLFDVLDAQLDAAQLAIDSVRTTLAMMREQAENARKARQGASREPPRTFGQHRRQEQSP